MSRVLVIGGNLFIGYELVRRLLARGDEVAILHRGTDNPFGQSVRDIRCDRNDTGAISRIVREGDFEYVFDNVYDWRRGTTGGQVRAAAAAGGPSLKRYVFMSSCAAYGEGLNRSEDSPLAAPHHPDLYCRNKADSERALFDLHAKVGIETVTLRPPFVYGPRNPFYRERFFWDRLIRGRPVIVPGDGSRLMQFVLVSDLVQAALLAAQSPEAAGKAYNIAHQDPVRQDEFVRAMARAAGVEPDLRYVARETIIRAGGQVFSEPFYFGQYFDMPSITMSTARAQRELGFTASNFEEGLSETFRDYGRGSRPDRERVDFAFDDDLFERIQESAP